MCCIVIGRDPRSIALLFSCNSVKDATIAKEFNVSKLSSSKPDMPLSFNDNTDSFEKDFNIVAGKVFSLFKNEQDLV